MSASFVLLQSTCFFYGLSFLLHLLSFLGVGQKLNRFAFSLMRIGFLVSTFYFLAEAVSREHALPVYHFSQAMAFFAWSIAFVYLVLLVRVQSESFGLALTPILFFFSVIACMYFNSEAKELSIVLNTYFAVHIISAFFAYACLTISFVAAILYLIQQHELKSKQAGKFYHKLPALEALERLIFQPMIWGAALLFLAMGVGFLWSKSAFGEFWFFDPKSIATFVTACSYSAILYSYYVSSLRGKKVVVISLFAFGMVIFSFIGMRFIGGSHNFMQ